jgi:sugar O-acyltransferase (sialic acid O-acetyltransferase NeuD family)
MGAGGHAQVVADILLRMKDAGEEITPIGYLDDNPDLKDERFLGLSVLGQTADLVQIPHESVIIAIGNNGVRKRLFQELLADGEEFATACHPSAVIAPDVQIGRGTVLCANVTVNPGSVIGNNVILNTACTIDHHNKIGDHAHIAPGVHLGGDVSVGEGSLIGIGATVMPQRYIGEGCIVGAGALVHKDLPVGVTVTGVPARIL